MPNLLSTRGLPQAIMLALAAAIAACGGGGSSSDPSAATPTPPPSVAPGATATGNGCWDFDFLEATGRQFVIESRSTNASGAVTGLLRQESRVLGLRSFEGQSRLATDTTVTLSTPSGQVSSVQRSTSYTQRSTNGGLTLFGDEGSMTAGAVTTAFRIVFKPPWTDTQHSLQPGQSVDQTWSGTSATNGLSAPLTGSRTIRFVSRETITVPAGTFATCRYDQTQPGQPGPVTTWLAQKWGAPVQVSSAGGLTQAVRLTVDGVVQTTNQ